MNTSIPIPQKFLDARYDASKYPGSANCTGVENGANCQYFAYELLRHYGYVVPDLRSSDLWEDTIHTTKVDELVSFDILFFNKGADPYGAHLGVYLREGEILHLSKEVGVPAIWGFEEFEECPKYKTFLGAKRIKKP